MCTCTKQAVLAPAKPGRSKLASQERARPRPESNQTRPNFSPLSLPRSRREWRRLNKALHAREHLCQERASRGSGRYSCRGQPRACTRGWVGHATRTRPRPRPTHRGSAELSPQPTRCAYGARGRAPTRSPCVSGGAAPACPRPGLRAPLSNPQLFSSSLHNCSSGGGRVGGLHVRTPMRESSESAEEKHGATKNPFAEVTCCISLRASPSCGISMAPFHCGIPRTRTGKTRRRR